MLKLFTRYVAIVAVFMHSLLCGNAYCCAMMCSVKDDETSVSHDVSRPVSTCPCHSEKQDHDTGHHDSGNTDSKHHCDHSHHFCQCLQSTVPNNGTDFRVVLSPNLFSLLVACSPTVAATFPTSGLNRCTLETMSDSSAPGVRLHLLLEHFLI